jgi:DNA-binding NarL/FixJ family response regulator
MPAGDVRLQLALLSSVHVHRELIASALARVGHFDVVAHLHSPTGLSSTPTVDVVVADAGNMSPFDLPQDLRSQTGLAAIVAYALDVRNERAVLDWASAGTLGFVQANAPLETLIAAIEGAGAGEVSCSTHVACLLLRRYRGAPPNVPYREGAARLTPREEHILALLAEGLSNKAIGYRLGIELGTVKNHVHNTLAKLSVKRRRDAAAIVRSVTTMGRPNTST